MKDKKSFLKNIHLLSLFSILLSLTLLSASFQMVQAETFIWKNRWVITVTSSGPDINGTLIGGALYTVDSLTDKLYGPFLEGQLGAPGGGLFDIAVTPNGKTAIVSNFGNSSVFFVDVSDPTNLHLLGSLNITFFAEDITITKDGKFALVADGGFSDRLASIDIANMQLIEVKVVNDTYHNGVDVAPDGTVITCDYFTGNLSTFTINNSGHLTYANRYPIPLVFKSGTNFTDRPVNVAVAPDGKTVLLADVSAGYVTVYKIMSLGVLQFAGRVYDLPPIWNSTTLEWQGSQQSITFSEDGLRAYVISNGLWDWAINNFQNNKISILNINGIGSVSLNYPGAATFNYNSSSQLFGVDCLAIASNKLYAGNPTLSNGVNYLHVVNLNSLSVSTITVGGTEEEIVTGVATIPGRVRLDVGGIVIPTNTFELLAPYLIAASIIIATISFLRYKKNPGKWLNSARAETHIMA